jgi:hypothetical protein
MHDSSMMRTLLPSTSIACAAHARTQARQLTHLSFISNRTTTPARARNPTI